MKAIYLFTLAALFSANLSFAQDDKATVLETVSKQGIEAKLQFLASDEMRGRQTPSRELEIAAKYLESYMKDNGVKPVPGMDGYMQAVEMMKTIPPTAGSLALGDSSYSFSDRSLLLSGGGSNITAPIAYLGYGLDADFEKADVKGKIVVVRTGTDENSGARESFGAGNEKIMRASEAGALAVVELYGTPQPQWKMLRYYLGREQITLDMGESSELPHIWIDDVGGKNRTYISEFEGEAFLDLESNAKPERFVTSNVIGLVEGTDKKLKDEYIIFSAHYDHVGVGEVNTEGDSIYNGTRDNAIGSVAVMEAIKNISRYPLKRSAIFIFFTGEEKGLLGSEWYVNHPVVPLTQTMMSYNCDNGGYNDTTFAMIVGLERVTAADDMIAGCEGFGLEAKPDQVLDQGLYARSDHYSFAQVGVPGVMFSTGATAFDDEIMKYLHQQTDNPNSVDYDYLYKFMSAYVYGGRLIGNSKASPAWEKGDEYYEKGKALYKGK